MKNTRAIIFCSRFWIFCFILPVAQNLQASSICYTEENFPNIVKINKGNNGLEFVAGGVNKNKTNGDAPRITLVSDKSWDSRTWEITGHEECKYSDCLKKQPGCATRIPKINLTIEEALNLRSFKYIPVEIEQRTDACTVHKDTIYFGISFYSGEGVSGVGGIGSYNIKTQKIEIRRLPILRDSSVTHIAFDGKLLWIATANNYECEGTPPANGLIRYDWDKNIVQPFEDINTGFCGFVIHDIYIDNKSVWVATDLGVSQADRTAQEHNYGWENGWRHYIPQTNKNEPMKQVGCNDLYTGLLKDLPRNDNITGGSSYQQLFMNLAKFKPYLLEKYVSELNK